MKKEEVLALVADKKMSAGLVFDEIASAVDSIEISVVTGDEELQKQLDQAKADLAAANSALDALKAAKADEDVQLSDAIAKVQADEEKLAKLKAFVNDLLGA